MDVNKVVFFDGVCNLCNASVQFIIENDKENIFKFASLQSDFGQKTLLKNNLDLKSFNSFIYLENNQLYFESTAALKVAKQLSFPISLMYVFIIVPPFIRNGIYKFIANNRYKWFGKQTSCWMPTPDLKEKFIN